ncbi:MAG: fibronectin type III domain-containing protein, partial [Paludibacter sp.]
MSRDYMSTWINSVQLTNTIDWYTLIDKYYLQKTGNVRYYARNVANSTAAVATMVTAATDAVAPIAPLSLVASNKTQASFTLDWAASDDLGVYAYQVFKDGSLVATTANTYFDFTGLTPNQTYSITVKAKDAAGNVSTASTPLSVGMLPVDTQKPSTPSGLSASAITTIGFVLTWTGTSTDNVGVTGYEAYNGTTLIGSSTGAGNTMTVNGLTEGTSYAVTLKAKDYAGNRSDSSSPITVQTTANGLLVYEPFNYTIGTVSNDPDGSVNLGNGLPATNSIGVPTGISTGLRGIYGSECTVVDGLSSGNLSTTGNAAKITNATWGTGVNVYRNMTTDPYLSYRVGGLNTGNFGADGKTLYVSFLAQTSSATESAFRVNIAGGRNVFIQNTATGWSLSDNGNTPIASTATLELNTPTLLVLKYQFVAGIGDIISLYKNPTIGQALGTPNATLTVGADFPGISGLTTRPAVANAMIIDEFRMGLSADAVMPVSIIDTENPSQPSNVQASSINNTGFTLNWTGSTDNVAVTGYEAFSDTTLTASSTGPGTVMVVTGLIPSTTYLITLKAKDDTGNKSIASSPAISVRTADVLSPSTLSVTSITNNGFTLSWTASATLGVTYEIYKDGTSIGTTAAGITSLNVTGLSAGKSYSFTVKAVLSGIYSVASAALNVTTAPVEPTTLQNTVPTSTEFTLSWTASATSGVSYEIYKDGTSIGTTTAGVTTYAVPGLTAGAT